MTELANPRSAESRVRRLLVLAVALGLVFGLVLGGLVVLARGNEARPTVRLADRVPADAHFYLELNTDLTSGPWRALPGLLDRLGSESEARDARDSFFTDIGLSYEGDVRPLLGDVDALAMVGWLRSVDEVDFVILVETGDPAGVRALIDDGWQANDPTARRIDGEGQRYELDVTTYDDGTDSPMVLTDRAGVVYISTSLDVIEDLIADVEDGPVLEGSDGFERLLGEFDDEALAFGYVSGELLDIDDPDFAEMMRAVEEAYTQQGVDFDLRDMRAAFAVTTTEDGFAADFLAYLPGASSEGMVTPAAPLEELAGAAPFGTSVFYAGGGLGQALDELLTALEEDRSGYAFQARDELAVLEDELGLSLRDDLLPLIGSGFAVAVGASGESELPVDFVAVYVESNDPAALQAALEDVAHNLGLDELAEFGAEVSYVIEVEGGFVVVGGPENEVLDALAAGGSLSEKGSYQRTLELLPDDPAQLLYIDLAELAALADEFDDQLGDSTSEIDLSALDGFGLATVVDDDLVRVTIALPLAPAQ